MKCSFCTNTFQPKKLVSNEAIEFLCSLDIPFKLAIPLNAPVNMMGIDGKLFAYSIVTKKGSVDWWKNYLKNKIILVYECFYSNEDTLLIKFAE